MSSDFGKNIKISIFGQSHSKAIGVVMDGVPAGEIIDMDRIIEFMKRRAPGNTAYSTPRKEDDSPEILSGIVDGVTCGSPICAIIKNSDTRSQDYDAIRDIPRPGHADFSAFMKYGNAHDIRGGGHFSGRLTAPLCFAGAVAMQILEKYGIKVFGHIYSVGDIKDSPFDYVNPKHFSPNGFPTLSKEAGKKMICEIEKAKALEDSVGGIIECAITGLPAGLGEPMFGGVENRISSAVFGIPAVKGIEFGAGFAAASMYASENNDEFYFDSNKNILTKTNNHGGILGGITTGMPIIFRVAIKPTPSIGKPQKSVSFYEKCNTELIVKGRHDPCIVPRALPAVEAAAALTILDMRKEQ